MNLLEPKTAYERACRLLAESQDWGVDELELESVSFNYTAVLPGNGECRPDGRSWVWFFEFRRPTNGTDKVVVRVDDRTDDVSFLQKM